MANKSVGLKAKHWKALELIEEGTLSYKEIADAIKMDRDSFYALCEGDQRKMGSTAALFKSELNKIKERNTAKVRHLVKDNKKIALYLMNDRLKELKQKKDSGTNLSGNDIKEITRMTNTVNKSTPNVEIGEFNVNQGMTKQELKDEFNRLHALAKDALVKKRVRSSK